MRMYFKFELSYIAFQDLRSTYLEILNELDNFSMDKLNESFNKVFIEGN